MNNFLSKTWVMWGTAITSWAISVILFVGLAALWGKLVPYDDSDPAPKRSGLVIHTDALTGCQYLRRPWSGTLTPRMAADGKQVCKK